jgi:hypothetical protein
MEQNALVCFAPGILVQYCWDSPDQGQCSHRNVWGPNMSTNFFWNSFSLLLCLFLCEFQHLLAHSASSAQCSAFMLVGCRTWPKMMRHQGYLTCDPPKWNMSHINRESIDGPCNVIIGRSAYKFAMSLHASI